jgi:hypothetical protein
MAPSLLFATWLVKVDWWVRQSMVRKSQSPQTGQRSVSTHRCLWDIVDPTLPRFGTDLIPRNIFLVAFRPRCVVAQSIVLWRVLTICDPHADSEALS